MILIDVSFAENGIAEANPLAVPIVVPAQVSAPSVFVVIATVFSVSTGSAPKTVELLIYSGFKRKVIKMERNNGYKYSATIPSEMITKGVLRYNIIVKEEDRSLTFPANLEGEPDEWDFYDTSAYEIRVIPSTNPIYLFNAKKDSDLLVRQWRNTFKLVPTKNEDEAEYQMNIENLFVSDNENLNAKPIYDYSFKHFILNRIEGRKTALSSKENIVFYGRALNNKSCKLQIAFVMNDGSSYGGVIEIGTELKGYKLSIKNLNPVKTVTLPRPYPSFLPYYLEHIISSDFDITKVESIQFSIGPGISKSQLDEAHGISMISVWLQ